MRTENDCIRELRTLRDQMARIAAFTHPTQNQLDEFSRLQASFDEKDAQRMEIVNDGVRDRMRSGLRDGSIHSERGAPVDDGEVDRSRTPAGEARRVIDRLAERGRLPSASASTATTLVEHGTPRDMRIAADWVTIVGSDAYLRAFAKMCSDPTRGHMLWTEEERSAFAAVEEFRAMSLSDNAGGLMVPFELDPTVLLSSAGVESPLLTVSRVIQTLTNVWHGVSSAGVTSRWAAENSETVDGSPLLAPVPITAHRLDSFVPFSFEIQQDAMIFAGEMQRLLHDSASILAETAYTTGDGIGQPAGLITGLVGTPSVVNTATPEAFVSGDVYGLQESLPPRFQANASWLGSNAILNKIEQMTTPNGSRVFEEMDGMNLVRKPVRELSTLNHGWNPAVTADNYVLVYGDFKAAFAITQRIGTTIELVPHLFGPTRLMPTGQRGFYLWQRTGSAVINANAARVLNVHTIA